MTDKTFAIGDYELAHLTAELEDDFGNRLILRAESEGAGFFIRISGTTTLSETAGAALDPSQLVGLAGLAARLVALADAINGEGAPA